MPVKGVSQLVLDLVNSVGDDVCLLDTGGVHGGACNDVKILVQSKVNEDTSGVRLGLGGGEDDGLSLFLQSFQKLLDAVVDKIFIDTDVMVILAVCRHGALALGVVGKA